MHEIPETLLWNGVAVTSLCLVSQIILIFFVLRWACGGNCIHLPERPIFNAALGYLSNGKYADTAKSVYCPLLFAPREVANPIAGISTISQTIRRFPPHSWTSRF